MDLSLDRGECVGHAMTDLIFTESFQAGFDPDQIGHAFRANIIAL